MRTALIFVALLSSTAFADRHTVTWLGATISGNALANTTDQPASFNAGARLSLTFEDAPLRMPPIGLAEREGRIVPELFAGFYADDTRVRSQIGAGVRLELDFARNQDNNPWRSIRGAIYFAPRLKISGPDRQGGAEFMIGEYLLTTNDLRIGWEGGLGVVKRSDLESTQSPELEALINIYIGL